MSRPLQLVLGVVLAACGRTPLTEETGAADAGVREAPSYVFVGTSCPDAGTEQDLAPASDELLALVETRALEECSGAGGDWLIGRERVTTRDYSAGSHACWFFPAALRGSSQPWHGVVRYRQTAALFSAPVGWCLFNADGLQPVQTSAIAVAWGLYRTPEGAAEAYERLRGKK